MQLIVQENPLDPSTRESYETDDVIDSLRDLFETFPPSARLFFGEPSEETDVTPRAQEEVDKLRAIKDGTFYCIVYPEGLALAVLLFSIGTLAVQFLLSQQKTPEQPKQRRASPNNELGDRQNQQRINQRIPDIYGTVRSTPDLISKPYSVYENNKEVEYAMMCVGRGHFSFDEDEIKDDTTKLIQVAGSSLDIYGPGTNPTTTAGPQLTVGTTITEPLFIARRSNSINGQVLRAPNANSITGSANVQFVSPDEIHKEGSAEFSFSEYFAEDDELIITNAAYSDGTTSVNLDGTYTVLSVSDDIITLSNPSTVNADWSLLTSFTDNQTGFVSPTLNTEEDKWIGPFTLDVKDLTHVYASFVAGQGLYKITPPDEETGEGGGQQLAVTVEIGLEATPVDANDDPTGPAETFTIELEGSAVTQDQRADTIRADIATPGRYSVRARRTTDQDLGYKGQRQDEVKWKDLYAMTEVESVETNSVTTIHSRTVATSGALSIKQRKLNLLVTREVPIDGNPANQTRVATKRVDKILSTIAQDTKIGNLTQNLVDVASWTSVANELIAYFGTEKAIEFCGTFDDDNLSFEEIFTSVCQTAFLVPYRQGQVIRVKPEKETENSTILFNHRNKIPSSETRAVTFGPEGDYDGIELEYFDPEDDAKVTFYAPEDQSYSNPNSIERIGIRNKVQARFHAFRELNKLRYQSEIVEFDCTQEAAPLTLADRILVADNTRADTRDGQVLKQEGLELTLSQPHRIESAGYTIFLQLRDGSIEGIPCSPSQNNSKGNKVTITKAPRLALVLERDKYANTTYQITENEDGASNAFLLTEKDSTDNFTYHVTAINYDERYYENDKDLVSAVVDEDGETS